MGSSFLILAGLEVTRQKVTMVTEIYRYNDKITIVIIYQTTARQIMVMIFVVNECMKPTHWKLENPDFDSFSSL